MFCKIICLRLDFRHFLFFGTCWWLTFAPITYGGVPAMIAYPLLFGAALVAGLFPAIFGAIFSLLLKRFGTYASLFAPFIWMATEFLRFNLTGNNWNAIGYSQAFSGKSLQYASVGGVYLVGFLIILNNSFFIWLYQYLKKEFGEGIFASYIRFKLYTPFSYMIQNDDGMQKTVTGKQQLIIIALVFLPVPIGIMSILIGENHSPSKPLVPIPENTFVIAVQPNVPMSGLKYGEREKLRERHIQLAQNVITNSKFDEYAEEEANTYSKSEKFEKDKKFYSDLAVKNFQNAQKVVIFPESPMNFMYENDREFQEFIKDFAIKNNVSVLFNSAEPNLRGDNLYNSAVMINSSGEKVAQYDKIHLVPFGEYVPLPEPVARFVPSMVGNFQYGSEYDLLPFGDAKGGVMICFESHFPSLSREFVHNGADVLIEMTNDGYLGETPVLRQHLANAVFRAIETNRPVLRVTNVGVTAFINERGEVLDAAKPYTEDTRVWTISKSNANQTFYVKYGEWFAWLCSLVSLGLLSICSWKKEKKKEKFATAERC
ncbi:MAG: apolipoprotein N-acyltransferase [Pyrinomonadaceae bacterium]